MRILVVEDEIKTGDYLQQGLSEAGFTVALARNGLDGQHLAATEPFDVIFSMSCSRTSMAGAWSSHYERPTSPGGHPGWQETALDAKRILAT